MEEFDFSTINFFETEHSFRTNACVGKNCIHDMQTYAEGYLKSAQILVDHVIKPENMSDRDILVHPILYSVRHSIELSIKHVLLELNDKTNIKTDTKLIDGHCLKSLWELFEKQASFDRRLVKFIEEIAPLVLHIDNADSDGQDFRYPTNNNGDKTYDGRMIVDLAAVNKFIPPLRTKIMFLFNLTDEIISERIVGAYTDKFNRDELEQLSKELSDIKSWGDPIFSEVKSRWKSKYNLSNTSFSKAIDFIKNHREFSGNIGNIGNKHGFIYLENNLLKDLVIEKYQKSNRLRLEVYNKFRDKLSSFKVAELETIYYFGISSTLSEHYDQEVKSSIKLFKCEDKDELEKAFYRVFSKTYFVCGVIKGLNKIGMNNLSNELDQYHIEEEIAVENLGSLW